MDTVELAKRIRIHALNMTSAGGSSHIGSSLSMADIVAVLYGEILQFDPQNPKMQNRDRFILSKGHAGAGVYAALAETGFFPIDKLKTHYKNGSDLSGHEIPSCHGSLLCPDSAGGGDVLGGRGSHRLYVHAPFRPFREQGTGRQIARLDEHRFLPQHWLQPIDIFVDSGPHRFSQPASI